ncbi:cold-shock protein [Lapillicoccus jejuensis]|uniref:cold-shock protein n=1 Tax=Lapillicoccus jejuensis TaxID=402171 RepID=UPI00114EBD61|nr:cold-shock protein [Lapillicoccus jejuensis]
MQASVHTFDEETGAGSVLLDDGREARFGADVFARSALLRLRGGQRVSVELAEGEAAASVRRLWIVGIGPGETIR